MNRQIRTLRALAPIALLVIPLTGCAGDRAASGPSGPGRMLVTLDDGDIGPRAFVDGLVARREEGASDTLTVLRLPLPNPGDAGARVEYAQALVPNTAVGGSATLAISPSGRLAAVACPQKAPDAATRAVAGAPDERTVTIIDLAPAPDGAVGARNAGTVELSDPPVAVDFHPHDDVLLIAGRAGGLALVSVTPEEVAPLADVSLAALWPNALAGAKVTGAAWRPDGRVIAVTTTGPDAVAFVRAARTDEGWALSPWGGPTEVRANPVSPTWLPDGSLLLVAERAIAPFTPGVVLRAATGTIGLVLPGDNASDHPLHDRVGELRVPTNVDAFAVSPSGDRVLVASRRPGDLYDGASDPQGGVLTLLSLDRRRAVGEVVATARASSFVSDVAFDGRDAAYVADFDNNEVQRWNVGRSSLEYSGVNVGTGAGPHAVRIVR